jgi:hypothetical protein
MKGFAMKLKRFRGDAIALLGSVGLALMAYPLASCGGGLSSAQGASGAAGVTMSGPPPGSLLLDTSTTGLTASGAYGWVTAPTGFLRGPQLDMVGAAGSEYSYTRPFPFPRATSNPIIDWTRPALTTEQLSGGVQLSTAQTLWPGAATLQWKQHPQYPTVMSELIGTPNWSSYGGVYASIHSAQATQETITR